MILLRLYHYSDMLNFRVYLSYNYYTGLVFFLSLDVVDMSQYYSAIGLFFLGRTKVLTIFILFYFLTYEIEVKAN